MAKPHFALEPLLEHRRLLEERLRRTVVASARACLEVHGVWRRAAEELQQASRDRAVLERLEARKCEARLARERRLEEP
jgi:hypothetical protein